MNVEQLYAALGRKQEALDKLNAEYDSLLAALSDVIHGNVASSRITVDLNARSWTRTAEGGAAEPGPMSEPDPFIAQPGDNSIGVH